MVSTVFSDRGPLRREGIILHRRWSLADAAPVVAVVGATGAVGRETLEVLEGREVPVGSLRPLASPGSARTRVPWAGRDLVVEALTDEALRGVDLALFTAGPEAARRFVPPALEAGTRIVDDSGAFAEAPGVPLVVPAVDATPLTSRPGLVASPDPVVIPLALALAPLRDVAGLRRVVVTTYESASGAGRRAMDELRDQAVALLSFRAPPVDRLPRRLAFDCLPEIGELLETGETTGERRLPAELRALLGTPDLPIGVTRVRVPVFVGHALAVHVELERPLSAEDARAALAARRALRIETSAASYPTADDCAGSEEVLVGRLRPDPSVEGGRGLAFWIVADNLRCGAANLVDIAERLVADRGA